MVNWSKGRIIIIIIIIIIMFITKTSPDKCDKAETVAVTGLLLHPVTKEDCKTFCPMSRIRPVTARPAPQR